MGEAYNWVVSICLKSSNVLSQLWWFRPIINPIVKSTNFAQQKENRIQDIEKKPDRKRSVTRLLENSKFRSNHRKKRKRKKKQSKRVRERKISLWATTTTFLNCETTKTTTGKIIFLVQPWVASLLTNYIYITDFSIYTSQSVFEDWHNNTRLLNHKHDFKIREKG